MKYFDKYYWQWIYTRYIKRLRCLLSGCDIHSYSSAYMPDDYSPPDYCKRCEACDDVYGIESTDYRIKYQVETFGGYLVETFREIF